MPAPASAPVFCRRSLASALRRLPSPNVVPERALCSSFIGRLLEPVPGPLSSCHPRHRLCLSQKRGFHDTVKSNGVTGNSLWSQSPRWSQRRGRLTGAPFHGHLLRPYSSASRGLPEVTPAIPHEIAENPLDAIEIALGSVVKVFTVSTSPNYFMPWQNKPQREVTGSGFVISGRRIVTNAHVVADQTFVKVRKHGSPQKFKAKVQAVGHECDLALLTVEEEAFWEGMQPLELGDIPFLQEAVAVVGYPQGGDNISVTGGVVSRVEPTQYVHGASNLMAIQIDAAINPGNSGGPALMGDKVVGVAFQNLANAENIGYIIPVPVINHFLEDVHEKGKYVGFCTLGLTCQATENAHLREHLKMSPGTTGVLVSKVHPLTDTHRWIKKDDVILAFDGFPIANDGTVHFRNKERITFDHLVSMKKAGETGLVKVLRDGQEMEFTIKLGPIRPLVPIHQFDQLPSYFIFAGFVFTPLTQPYLHEYGDDWYNSSPRRLCDRALYATPKKLGEQIVILSQILVDDINAGYERLAELQVKRVNLVDILNLSHLRQLVDECKETNIRFDLEDGRVVVLNYAAAREASLRILDRHRISEPMSKDLVLRTVDADLEEWEKADDSCEDMVSESVSC